MGSPEEPGPRVDPTPFVLRDDDSAAPASGDAALVEADALEEQGELAPAAPSPIPPRPSFGSFGPLVPSDPLTREFPRTAPLPSGNPFARESNGGTGAPDAAREQGTSPPPAAQESLGAPDAPEEQAVSATLAETPLRRPSAASACPQPWPPRHQ